MDYRCFSKRATDSASSTKFNFYEYGKQGGAFPLNSDLLSAILNQDM